MSGAGRIVRINPAAGIPGGEVVIECEGFDTSDLRSCGVWFGRAQAQLVGCSTRRRNASKNVIGQLDHDQL